MLISELFDEFLLIEATITMLNQFIIDGHLHKEFYDKEEWEQKEADDRTYSLWKEVKPICFQLIKGSKTPLQFKFTFQQNRANTVTFLNESGLPMHENDVNGLYFNIRFDGKNLVCTTATSLNIFTMDKTLEHEWDNTLKRYLSYNEIPFEES